MENTNENRAAFLKHYQGTGQIFEDVYNSLWYLVPSAYHGSMIDLGNRGLVKVKDAPPLLLKSVLSITNEEKVKCGEILGFDFTRKNVLSLGKNIATSIALGDLITKEAIKVYQYLQSRGYALPYMDLSIEDLVAMCWIKLIV